MDNKEPFGGMSLGDVATALWLMEDKKRHPLLVHCATGRNRTGCIVACYRRIHGWSLTAIFEEYLRFAGSSASLMDMQFIELFTALPSADTTSLILKGGGLHVTEDP
jgi:tyrosine-protein phosphatase SIW14